MMYTLKNHDTDLYRNKEEFQLAQKDLITYMMKVIYWYKMEVTGSMLGSLIIIFAILLCLC